MNRESFQGQLPDAEIVWSDLTERKGVTHWMDDGSFKIEVDRATNPNERELRDTVQHEACHIATLPHLEHGDDVHGAAFKHCMTGFDRVAFYLSGTSSAMRRLVVETQYDFTFLSASS